MAELDEEKSTDLLILEQLTKLNEKEGKLISLGVEGRNQAKWLKKGQLKTNKRLGDICNYKEDQKQGDIKHRKLTGKQNKISLLLHLVSISIASAAFYISIAGLPVFISVWVKGVL